MIAADQKLLTYEEAGARIGRSKWFIADRVADGQLKATVFGYRTKRIAEMDLLRYIESCRDHSKSHKK